MLGVKWTGGSRGMIRARHERVGAHTNTVRAVAGCDVVFGCMDSIDGRHLLNKLATFYVIPYFDPSVKLEADGTGGGDAAENAARGFHDTAANELIGHTNRRAIALRSRTTQPDLRRPNLKWETLVFAMPDDGTGSLPLLRHVIVNDNKSSTYKLGLLRPRCASPKRRPGWSSNARTTTWTSHSGPSACTG